VSVNGADYAYGDSYWPQLGSKRHGGNGSMFIVPARRFQSVHRLPNPLDRSEANVTPLYDAVTRSSGRPHRLPAGWVLPVKISLVDSTDQGPYYLRVRSTAGLLNPAPLYRASSGGAPWVLIYDDTLRREGTDWRLADDVPLQRYNGRRRYMLALAVFAERPTAANSSFQLNAAPDGDDGYRPATGNW